jgi:hypothetical protein
VSNFYLNLSASIEADSLESEVISIYSIV